MRWRRCAGPTRTQCARSSRPSRSMRVAGRDTMMPGDDLAFLGIRELGRRFRAHELSPVELTTVLLRRIERLDPKLHAFVTVTADRAMADAKAAEAAIARGDGRPLLGIPVAYKDLYA